MDEDISLEEKDLLKIGVGGKLFGYKANSSIHTLMSRKNVVTILLFLYINRKNIVTKEMIRRVAALHTINKLNKVLITISHDPDDTRITLTKLGFTIAEFQYRIHKWALNKFYQKQLEELFDYKESLGIDVDVNIIFKRIEKKLMDNPDIEEQGRLLIKFKSIKDNYIPSQKSIDTLYSIERIADKRIGAYRLRMGLPPYTYIEPPEPEKKIPKNKQPAPPVEVNEGEFANIDLGDI